MRSSLFIPKKRMKMLAIITLEETTAKNSAFLFIIKIFIKIGITAEQTETKHAGKITFFENCSNGKSAK